MHFVRFDSVGGASGDMLLGALTAAGADLAAIQRTLRKVLPDDVRLTAEPVADHGLHGSRVSVHCRHAADMHHWPDSDRQTRHSHAPHRTLGDISRLLSSPALNPATRQLALAVFKRLAEVEGKIHGKSPASIHFHEIGATDSIADIVGCCLALHQLDVQGVAVGPLPCGIGTIVCAHGTMPNPAPATLELLAGMEVVQTDEPFELVTPTAAALLVTWRERLATPPAHLRVVRSGFGFGRRLLQQRPNVLRATLFEHGQHPAGPAEPANLLILETNIDDCNPQWIGDLIPQLLKAGALDAWTTPATMKKGRPGLVVSVLAPGATASAIADLIFASTTTFGIRTHAVERITLDRRFETVPTSFGAVRVKVGSLHGRDIVRTPEFEDCARAARASGATPRQVCEAALLHPIRKKGAPRKAATRSSPTSNQEAP